MAQIIQFPFSFEFRTTKVRWAEAAAHIVGWRWEDDGTIDRENLIAEITTSGTTRSLEFPLADVAEEIREQCVVAFEEGGDDKDVERICSAFEPGLLVASRGSQDGLFTGGIADFLQESPDSLAFFKKYGLLQEDRDCLRANAWLMREDFFRMDPDSASAIAFLDRWGCWGVEQYVRPQDLFRLQRAAREALMSPPAKWFASSFSLPFFWQRSRAYPFFAIQTDMCEKAICMTVTIDLLHRVKFKVCARRDCHLPFAVSSNHKRKYCTQYCGHLESVRRNRKITHVGVGNKRRSR